MKHERFLLSEALAMRHLKKPVDQNAVEKAAALDLLDRYAGVGLWDAELFDGNPMHERSRWRWSAEFRRLLGFSSEDEFPNVVTSWSDRLHPDDAEPTFAAFGACLGDTSGCTGYSVEYRLKNKPGKYQWFRAVGGVARDSQGKALRACGSLIDINAERVAKEEHEALIVNLTNAFEQSVKRVAESVSSHASHVQSMATSLSDLAEQTSRQSAAAAAASNVASTNVQTVATAAEELAASIKEIGRQLERSSKATQDVSSSTRDANATMKELADLSSKIGDVVNLINAIASQTNLLALNATIEAGRAGDAGKGFAVVAQEVKILANQTARATEDISQQIASIQSATTNAVHAIRDIVGRIQEINEIAGAIAAAIEEQTAATSEIARNIAQAANGTQEMSSNVVGVTEVAQQTGDGARQVLSSAHQLTQEAGKLQDQVASFLSAVRAA